MSLGRLLQTLWLTTLCFVWSCLFLFSLRTLCLTSLCFVCFRLILYLYSLRVHIVCLHKQHRFGWASLSWGSFSCHTYIVTEILLWSEGEGQSPTRLLFKVDSTIWRTWWSSRLWEGQTVDVVPSTSCRAHLVSNQLWVRAARSLRGLLSILPICTWSSCAHDRRTYSV